MTKNCQVLRPKARGYSLSEGAILICQVVLQLIRRILLFGLSFLIFAADNVVALE